MTHTDTSSFGKYELLRILIPGFYFTSLIFLTISFCNMSIVINIYQIFLIFVLSIILSGLTMYARETTKRRKAFNENLPSNYIQELARRAPGSQPLESNEAKQIYFYILNNYLPSIFHDKIFYFGTLYHIMIQIRRTSFWFGLLTLACIILHFADRNTITELQSLILFMLIIWIIYFLNVKYNKADRKMQENYQDQILWLRLNEPILKEVLKKYFDSKYAN